MAAVQLVPRGYADLLQRPDGAGSGGSALLPTCADQTALTRGVL